LTRAVHAMTQEVQAPSRRSGRRCANWVRRRHPRRDRHTPREPSPPPGWRCSHTPTRTRIP
jgi:hypothetical protein